MTAPIKTSFFANHLHRVLLIAVLYLLGFYGYSATFFWEKHYLPAPFFGDISDSWMDFYNINFYAAHADFYTKFASFYSPLNVLIAQVLSDPACIEAGTPKTYRICNPWSALLFLGLTWMLSLIFLWHTLRGCKLRGLWFVVIGFSFPMVFAMERANYLMLAIPILFLWLGSHARWNFVFELLLANIKYYLLLFQGFYLVRNRLIHVAVFMVALLVFSVVLGSLTGLPGVANIPKNLVNFVGGPGGLSFLFNTTVDAYVGIQQLFFLGFGNKQWMQLLVIAIKLFIVIRLWIYLTEIRLVIEQHWMNFILLIVLLLITSAPGFYGQVLLLPYMAYFLQKNYFNKGDQFFLILLCLPYPVKIKTLNAFHNFYLFDETMVGLPLELFLQSLIQPLLLFVLFMRLTTRVASPNI